MARSRAELFTQGLPKWPQHYVTGTPVTVEQAKDIIRRTDTFFSAGYGGNNHEYDRWVRKTLGMQPDWIDRPRDPEPPKDETEEQKAVRAAAWKQRWEAERAETEAFERRWRAIRTGYVHNSWVSCSFIGGPYGWCHPDGKIGFVDNVGKWPSVEDILKDWQILAEAFPFIEVGVTLYDGESSEDGTRPVVSMRVHQSRVELIDPAEVNVHDPHAKATRRGDYTPSIEESIFAMGNSRREQGLPDEWISEWATKYGPGATL